MTSISDDIQTKMESFPLAGLHMALWQLTQQHVVVLIPPKHPGKSHYHSLLKSATSILHVDSLRLTFMLSIIHGQARHGKSDSPGGVEANT